MRQSWISILPVDALYFSGLPTYQGVDSSAQQLGHEDLQVNRKPPAPSDLDLEEIPRAKANGRVAESEDLDGPGLEEGRGARGSRSRGRPGLAARDDESGKAAGRGSKNVNVDFVC